MGGVKEWGMDLRSFCIMKFPGRPLSANTKMCVVMISSTCRLALAELIKLYGTVRRKYRHEVYVVF